MKKMFEFHITAIVPANGRTQDEIADIILDGLDNAGTTVSFWEIEGKLKRKKRKKMKEKNHE